MHPLFRRGHEELLGDIKRKAVKKHHDDFAQEHEEAIQVRFLSPFHESLVYLKRD